MMGHNEPLQARLTYALMFLFPLAGNSLRSWTTTMFLLLVVLALATQPWRKIPVLHPWERHILWLLPLLFGVFLLSNWVNGWTDTQTRGLSVMVRFLLIVPIYLLLRVHEHALLWLIRGCLAAATVLVLQGGFEIFIQGQDRAYGVYLSPGLLGTQALIFGTLLVFSAIHRPLAALPRALALLGILLAGTALLLSGSRATFFTFWALLLLLPWLILPWRRIPMAYGAIIVLFSALYLGLDHFHERINSAVNEIAAYSIKSEPRNYESHASVGQRLEMWQTAWLIFREHPVLGVGWRNFGQASAEWVAKGLAHPVTTESPHPHNTYLTFMVTTGTVGTLLLLILLFYPYRIAAQIFYADKGNKPFLLFPVSHPYLYLRRPPPLPGPLPQMGERRRNAYLALSAKVFMLIFIINGINEGGMLIYGNFLAVFLVFFAALFSALARTQDPAPRPHQNPTPEHNARHSPPALPP